MPFQYSDLRGSPAAGSIAELMLRRGEIAAQHANAVANAQARAVETSGNAWAGATAGLGNMTARTILEATDPQRKLDAAKAQMVQGQLADQNSLRAGQRGMDAMMAGDQLPAGATGPRQESYLRPDGLYDIPKLNQGLASMGVGHLAPDLLKHAEDLNNSIATAQQHDQQAAQSKAVMLGFMANGALKLHQTVGMPLDGAIDFIAQPGLATQQIKPQELAAFKQQIAQLPPEQQVAALQQIKAHAAEIAPTKEHAKDSTTTNIYGEQIASNIVTDPTKGDYTGPDGIRYHANGTPVTGAVMKPQNATAEQDDQRYRDIQAKQLQGIAVAPPDLAWAKGYEKQKTLGVDTTASAAATRQANAIAAQTAQQARSQNFTEAQAGRKELTDKVETPYRQAQQSAQELRDLVHAAQGGNKEAASLQTLQATMSTVRANGLNRLNQAEMKLPEGAGSVWDRVAGKVGKLTAGQPIDASLQKDLLDLADLMEKGAYNRYATSHHDITTRYKLTDEKPSEPPSGYWSIKAPDGNTYTFPSQEKLDAFKTKAGLK